MTGHSAIPYFNAFMDPFMKGKPIEKFPSPPPMPADVKSEAEMRKREELEQLQEADTSGKRNGITSPPGAKIDPNGPLPGEITTTDSGKPTSTEIKPTETRPTDAPPVVKPPVAKPTPKVEKPPEPSGTKPKGKKGDGK